MKSSCLELKVINGPNLNLTGSRQNEIYGDFTLSQINANLTNLAINMQVELSFYQSNIEGDLINEIQRCKTSNIDGLLVNLAAYTHTSIALYDTLLACNIPFVEIHLSNIFSREKFRSHSYISKIALGVISGFGGNSYKYGLMALVDYLGQKAQS